MHGYVLSLDPTNDYFNLIKLDPSQSPLPFRNLVNDHVSGLTVLTGDRFEMSFEVCGDVLTGRLYNSAGTLLDTITTTDGSYTDGVVGTWAWNKGGTIEGTWSDLGLTANTPPTVATAAAATPSPVAGTTAVLSVLGADDGGESNLSYTWATTGTPPASVSFSANGTNAAKNTTATFTKAGNYTFQVTITDAGNLSTTSSVNVTVNQTLTTITVTPASVTLNESQTQQFSATANRPVRHCLEHATVLHVGQAERRGFDRH